MQKNNSSVNNKLKVPNADKCKPSNSEIHSTSEHMHVANLFSTDSAINRSHPKYISTLTSKFNKYQK